MNKIITYLIICIGITSCSTISYMTDNLNNVNAAKFRTYATQDNCDDNNINPIMLQRVKNAIDINMRNHNITPSEDPDLLVQYFIKNEYKSFIANCRLDYDSLIGGEDCRTKVVSYEEGSIVIDFVDTENNTIVWHGAIKGRSFNYMKEPNAKINEMVSNLIDMFFEENESGVIAIN